MSIFVIFDYKKLRGINKVDCVYELNHKKRNFSPYELKTEFRKKNYQDLFRGKSELIRENLRRSDNIRVNRRIYDLESK